MRAAQSEPPVKLALVLLLVAAPLPAQRLLDPDTCWTCWDSVQHFGSGVAIDVGVHALFPKSTVWQRLGFNVVVGVVWELAQADVARSANLSGPGHGFGFKDLAMDALGAIAGELLWRGARIL